MFRIWAKIFKDNHILKDIVIKNNNQHLNRTKKIYDSLDAACYVWLDKNIADFKRSSKVRFTQDNFIDSIDFDYLELQVLEED